MPSGIWLNLTSLLLASAIDRDGSWAGFVASEPTESLSRCCDDHRRGVSPLDVRRLARFRGRERGSGVAFEVRRVRGAARISREEVRRAHCGLWESNGYK